MRLKCWIRWPGHELLEIVITCIYKKYILVYALFYDYWLFWLIYLYVYVDELDCSGRQISNVLQCCVGLEGGKGTLQTILDSLKQNTPVVLINGCGRAVDLLAFVYEKNNELLDNYLKENGDLLYEPIIFQNIYAYRGLEQNLQILPSNKHH